MFHICSGGVLAPARRTSHSGNPWVSVLISWLLVQVNVLDYGTMAKGLIPFTPNKDVGNSTLRTNVICVFRHWMTIVIPNTYL